MKQDDKTGGKKGSLWDYNLKEFRDRIASREPVPGGGSVAAVAAAEGLALVLMALEISSRRKDPLPNIKEVLARGKDLLEEVSACADEDAAAFEGYMDALRLPGTTGKENEARTRAMEVARSNALEAPLRAAQRSLEALDLARESMQLVHAGIASDVGAGAALLHGALTATLYNVDINLRGIIDPAEHREALTTRNDLQRRANELAYVIHRETEEKIARAR